MKNQETKTKKSKKKVLLYYLILAACLLIIAAVTVTVIFTVKSPNPGLSVDSGQEQPDDGNDKDPDDGDDPTSAELGYFTPVKSVAVANLNEFFHNETLGWYYVHEGLDFAGEAGDEVYAIKDGKVKEVVYDTEAAAVLFGGYLVIDHGNGIEATYKFIDIADGIGRGSEIKRGQVLGRLSQPTGTETFVGAHLHLEIRENGELADPETFLEIVGK